MKKRGDKEEDWENDGGGRWGGGDWELEEMKKNRSDICDVCKIQLKYSLRMRLNTVRKRYFSALSSLMCLSRMKDQNAYICAVYITLPS